MCEPPGRKALARANRRLAPDYALSRRRGRSTVRSGPSVQMVLGWRSDGMVPANWSYDEEDRRG